MLWTLILGAPALTLLSAEDTTAGSGPQVAQAVQSGTFGEPGAEQCDGGEASKRAAATRAVCGTECQNMAVASRGRVCCTFYPECKICELRKGGQLTARSPPSQSSERCTEAFGGGQSVFDPAVLTDADELDFAGDAEFALATVEPRALFDEPRPTDPRQGALGDCWLLASMSALARYPQVTRLFRQRFPTADGVYDVQLYDYLAEPPQWVRVRVSDTVAMPAGAERWDDLKYTKLSQQGETWPALLEKAVAQFTGRSRGCKATPGGVKCSGKAENGRGYVNLHGGNPEWGLLLLTGTESTKFLAHKTIDADGNDAYRWIRKEMNLPKMRELTEKAVEEGTFDPRELAFKPIVFCRFSRRRKVYNDPRCVKPGFLDESHDQLWAAMVDADQHHYPMTAGTPQGNGRSKGLLGGHAYAVVDVVEVKPGQNDVCIGRVVENRAPPDCDRIGGATNKPAAKKKKKKKRPRSVRFGLLEVQESTSTAATLAEGWVRVTAEFATADALKTPILPGTVGKVTQVDNYAALVVFGGRGSWVALADFAKLEPIAAPSAPKVGSWLSVTAEFTTFDSAEDRIEPGMVGKVQDVQADGSAAYVAFNHKGGVGSWVHEGDFFKLQPHAGPPELTAGSWVRVTAEVGGLHPGAVGKVEDVIDSDSGALSANFVFKGAAGPEGYWFSEGDWFKLELVDAPTPLEKGTGVRVVTEFTTIDDKNILLTPGRVGKVKRAEPGKSAYVVFGDTGHWVAEHDFGKLVPHEIVLPKVGDIVEFRESFESPTGTRISRKSLGLVRQHSNEHDQINIDFDVEGGERTWLHDTQARSSRMRVISPAEEKARYFGMEKVESSEATTVWEGSVGMHVCDGSGTAARRGVVEVSGLTEPLRLVQVRDPHGTTARFEGKFGRREDAEWEKYPGVKQVVAKLGSLADGMSWMLFDDFVAHFREVTISPQDMLKFNPPPPECNTDWGAETFGAVQLAWRQPPGPMQCARCVWQAAKATCDGEDFGKSGQKGGRVFREVGDERLCCAVAGLRLRAPAQ